MCRVFMPRHPVAGAGCLLPYKLQRALVGDMRSSGQLRDCGNERKGQLGDRREAWSIPRTNVPGVSAIHSFVFDSSHTDVRQ